jgi:hypothetical protein
VEETETCDGLRKGGERFSFEVSALAARREDEVIEGN